MWSAVLGGALLWLAPAEESSGLEWDAPPSCPDAEAGRALVEEHLEGREHADISGQVTIRAEGDQWVATVSTGSSEARALQSQDCETVARAAAVVLAIALVPPDASQPPESPARPDPEPEPEPLPDPARVQTDTAATRAEIGGSTTGTPTVTEPAPVDRPVLVHGLGVRGGVAYGPATAVAGALRLGYRLGAKWWRIEADVAATTPRRIRYPGENVGGRFFAVSGALRGCGLPGVSRVTFPVCLGAEIGGLFGLGFGADRPNNGVSTYVGLVGGAGVEVRLLRWLALHVGGDLVVNVRRPAFDVGERPLLFRTSRIGGRGLLGLEFRVR